jgi:hypothetical protein
MNSLTQNTNPSKQTNNPIKTKKLPLSELLKNSTGKPFAGMLQDHLDKLDRTGVDYYIGGSTLSYLISPKSYNEYPDDLDVYIFDKDDYDLINLHFTSEKYDKHESASKKVTTMTKIGRKVAVQGKTPWDELTSFESTKEIDYHLQTINLYEDRDAFANFYSPAQVLYDVKNQTLLYTDVYTYSMKNNVLMNTGFNPAFYQKIERYITQGFTIDKTTMIEWCMELSKKDKHKILYTVDSTMDTGSILSKVLESLIKTKDLALVEHCLTIFDGKLYSPGFKVYDAQLQTVVNNNATAMINQRESYAKQTRSVKTATGYSNVPEISKEPNQFKIPDWAMEELNLKWPELLF